MDVCPICLDDMNENEIIKTLSCDHKFHFSCFKKLVCHNNNFYVDCPICREMNYNIDKPFKDNHKKNILIMCHGGVGKLQCVCTTNKGEKCKNKSLIMNYGKCYVHNKDILPKKYYKLFSDYLYHMLCSNYNWLTIIYLLDVGKKIMIKYLNENDQIHDILQYYYRYLNDKKYRKNNDGFYMNGIYDYYDLEYISKNWLDYCINKNIII